MGFDSESVLSLCALISVVDFLSGTICSSPASDRIIDDPLELELLGLVKLELLREASSEWLVVGELVDCSLIASGFKDRFKLRFSSLKIRMSSSYLL